MDETKPADDGIVASPGEPIEVTPEAPLASAPIESGIDTSQDAPPIPADGIQEPTGAVTTEPSLETEEYPAAAELPEQVEEPDEENGGE